MALTGFRIRPAAALAAVATVLPLPAAADCTCRALGTDFELGRSVCLSTSQGARLALCGMVLNNTSWHFSDVPCVVGQEFPGRVSGLVAQPAAEPLKLPIIPPADSARSRGLP
jgi:hypothetical protein